VGKGGSQVKVSKGQTEQVIDARTEYVNKIISEYLSEHPSPPNFKIVGISFREIMDIGSPVVTIRENKIKDFQLILEEKITQKSASHKCS
jgi:hypothetical protein